MELSAVIAASVLLFFVTMFLLAGGAYLAYRVKKRQ
jgi:hypothetical protein